MPDVGSRLCRLLLFPVGQVVISMPKARQTCTQCSLRRQKCDRRQPCARCVKRGVADRCTIEWTAGERRSNVTVVAREHRSLERNSNGGNTPVTPSVAAMQADDLSSGIYNSLTPHSTATLTRVSRGWHGQSSSTDCLISQLMFFQLLVPETVQIERLVNYAEKRVLWYHGCYHGPTFNAELQYRLSASQPQTNKKLTLRPDDLQWTALFFAVISGTMTCASPQAALSMGFDESEAQTLSRHWHRASIVCLELSEYRIKHSIHTVQAIATLTMCAHTLGRSTEQYILMGSAIHLARSLNLHRLSLGDEAINHSSSSEFRDTVLRREVGRRLFCQLCVQDWFSIPFTGAHSIHRGDFTTVKPQDRDYITMESLPAGEPNYVSYNNYLYEIAALIASLHESLARCNTDFTRYEKVLEVDSRMRELATRDRPPYFDVTVPIDTEWPWFVPWARRSLTICFAHKMIIIHKTFLKRSFSDEPFDYSRRTCVAAAKTILNEASQPRQVEEPVIWIDQVCAPKTFKMNSLITRRQAFSIAAGITILIYLINRPTAEESERESCYALGERCILVLSRYQHSLLAARGVRLLRLLLKFAEEPVETRSFLAASESAYEVLRYIFDGSMEDPPPRILSLADVSAPDISNEDRLELSVDTVPELFPAQVGFSNEFVFQELLGFKSLARLSVVR